MIVLPVSFQFGYLFVCCLIGVVRTSSAILNRTGEDDILVLFRYLVGGSGSFFLFIIFCVFGFGNFFGHTCDMDLWFSNQEV